MLIPCGICGSDVFRRRFAATDLRIATPGSWDVATCAKCGVTLLNPPPSNEALAAAYPDWLWQNDIPRRNAKPYRVNRTLDVLARHVSPPGMLFDVGCGPGSLLAEATHRGWTASGIESSLAQVEHCRAHGHAAEHVADFTAMRDDGRRYDAVVFDHVLEHVPAPVAYLRKAFELAKPGGFVLIGVPNYASLSARAFGPYWMHLDPPRHLYHFTPKTLAACVSTAGGRVVRIETGDREDNAAGARESLRRWIIHGVVGRPAKPGKAATCDAPPKPSLMQRLFDAYGVVASQIGNGLGMPDTIIAVAQR
jgi:SAM-dependent methyltransferase